MAFRKRYLLSNEQVNSHGFWLVVKGIDLTDAKLNLPCFFNHRTWEVPLGHWENLELKGDELYAELVIEGANEAEKEYIRKIENGDLKGCSMGLDPLEWSDASEYIKQGQRISTLTKSVLFEVSITPLPSNKAAMSLKHKGSLITLTDEDNTFLPTLKTTHDMKEIAILLGLAETATDAQVRAKITELQLKATNGDAAVEFLKAEGSKRLVDDTSKKQFESLCATAAGAAVSFLALAAPATAEAVPGADGAEPLKPAVVKDIQLSKVVQAAKDDGGADAADPKKTFDYLQRHNVAELTRIKNSEPDNYAKLAADYAAGVRYNA